MRRSAHRGLARRQQVRGPAVTKPDPNLVLVVKYDADNGFGGWHGQLTAVICYSNDGPIARAVHDPGALLSPTWSGSVDLYQDYADLMVTGSLSQDFDGWLNWEYTYRNVYSVDLPRATAMAKTVRRLDKAMGTLAEVRGTPTDFSTYLARFAEVIGCHRYAERSDTMLPNGSLWRHLDVDGMRRWVAKRETQFRSLYVGNP